VLVGSSRERRGFDTAVDEAVSDAMVARAPRLFPRLASLPREAAWAGCGRGSRITCRQSGRRRPSRAQAGDGHEGAGVAHGPVTGHEGAGVAHGPVTGRLVAQLYCGEPPVADPAPFDPDRFGR
jgi:D-hydroxyproline dehydrogenase subunit beta